MSQVPGCVVFDLDNCAWTPEMYQLWGRGGAPFTPLKNGNVKDRGGHEVALMGSVREIWNELDTDPKWENTLVAVASTCDEPEWARECLSKIVLRVDQGGRSRLMEDVIEVAEIHKGSKKTHFQNIHRQTGVAFEDMVFFDDQRGNCEAVATLGVSCYLTPTEGVTRHAWETMMKTFPLPGKITRCE
mmetsp:Transcript_10731/g.18953  ORF Transcript_10731/g.18953 Transcript_10731/m.18953 type:complete len:187 (+) Transcript_10731:186-746(+)